MSFPDGNNDARPEKSTGARKKKLFFALQPDDVLRGQLVNLQQESMSAQQGRSVAAENLHITLVFLGLIDESQEICAENVATEIVAEAFELTLDKIGHWARPRILWAGPSKIPEPMVVLVSRLTRGLQVCGIKLDDRSYSPHVTLARKVSTRPGIVQMTPLSWSASRYDLMESVSTSEGVKYQSLASWPLK